MDEAVLEEGEILDSDSNDEEIDALKAGTSAPQTSAGATAPGMVLSAATSLQHATASYRLRKCPGLSSSDEADDSWDSDDEHGQGQKRTRCMPPKSQSSDKPFTNPLRTGQGAQVMEEVWNRMEARFKKSNSVWLGVLQEQTLTGSIGRFGVEANEHIKNSDRDVESYDYTLSLKDPRNSLPGVTPGPGPDGESDLFDDAKPDGSDSEVTPEPELVDIECFGFDVKAKPASAKLRLGKRKEKRKINKELGQEAGPNRHHSAIDKLSQASSEQDNRETDMVEQAEFSGEHQSLEIPGRKAGDSIKQRLGSQEPARARKRKHNVNMHERLGKKSFDKSKNRQHVKVVVEDPPERVAQELMEQLEEPDYMEELWLRVPEKLGNKLALELLYMTEDLEEVGGLWINNGSRRRTPGGVYLHLLKGHKNITEEQKNYIFSWDKQEKNKAKKAVKKRALRRKKEALESMVDRTNDDIAPDTPTPGDYLAELKTYAEKKKKLTEKAALTHEEDKKMPVKATSTVQDQSSEADGEGDQLDELEISGDIELDIE